MTDHELVKLIEDAKNGFTYFKDYYVTCRLAEDNAKFKIKFDAFDGKLVTKEEFKEINRSLKSDNTKTWRMMEYQGQIKLKVWNI